VVRVELKVLKRTEQELRLEVVGESHTLLNLLQKELVKDPAVEIGGYDVIHPLERPIRSVLYVRTTGAKRPEEALLEAIERARKTNEEFAQKLQEALASFSGREGEGHGESA